MSLRARLALLYTSILGGILLVFGVVIYQIASITLIDQVDASLEETANDITGATHLNEAGHLETIALTNLDLPANFLIQLWEGNRLLRASYPEVNLIDVPLDSRGMLSIEPAFRDSRIDSIHLRVLSVPLSIGNRPIGTLQVGADLAVVDSTQKTLLSVVIVGVLIAMGVAGMAIWFSTYRALAPLEAVTNTALQITHADDLSYRIPYQGPAGDEIGQLINAFNQTLGRLETLFMSQRRFLEDVGHELRTPLTVIKGNVNLLRRMGCADEESIEGIENEVDWLTRLVGDLLVQAQAESGKIPLDNHVVELDTLLLEVLQHTKVLTKDRIKMRIDEIDQVLVCGDRDRLKQVLLNIIGNAIKYTPTGGEVVTSLGKEADQARVTVIDNGPGIPKKDMPFIFERFYRVEKSRTRSRESKGFGLGLSIAYWIIQNHGGHIDVSSEEGQGTTFKIWLPLTNGDCPNG